MKIFKHIVHPPNLRIFFFGTMMVASMGVFLFTIVVSSSQMGYRARAGGCVQGQTEGGCDKKDASEFRYRCAGGACDLEKAIDEDRKANSQAEQDKNREGRQFCDNKGNCRYDKDAGNQREQSITSIPNNRPQPTPTSTTNNPTNTPTPTLSLTPTATPTATLTPTPTPTTPAARGPGGESVTLNLKLKFQGITSQPVSNSMTVKVSLVSSSGTKVDSSGIFTANSNGVWSGAVSFNTVSAGTNFNLLIKGPRHVQKKVCVATPTEAVSGTYHCSTGNISIASGANTFDLSGIMQMSGDLPVQDGIINSYDISLIQNNLNTNDQSIIAKADVNNDGRVDSQDFSLVMATLGIKTDEE